MLSGPTNDYFSDSHHLRGGFPTPNESSLRTGLTPGGSGSMFPVPSPNSQLFAQLAGSGATPGTLDFHRTALSAAAAAKRDGQNQPPNQPSVTSQPQDMANGLSSAKPEAKPAGPFDPHDNDAANGLFMLAQGAQTRNGGAPASGFPSTSQPPSQQTQVHAQAHAQSQPAPVPSAAPAVQPLDANHQMASVNGVAPAAPASSTRSASEGGSTGSDEAEQTKPNTRGKGKKGGATTTNGRRKAEDAPAKGPASKKSKTSTAGSTGTESQGEEEQKSKTEIGGTNSKAKMTDEEKRKNFLERNR